MLSSGVAHLIRHERYNDTWNVLFAMRYPIVHCNLLLLVTRRRLKRVTFNVPTSYAMHRLVVANIVIGGMHTMQIWCAMQIFLTMM